MSSCERWSDILRAFLFALVLLTKLLPLLRFLEIRVVLLDARDAPDHKELLRGDADRSTHASNTLHDANTENDG